MRPRTLIAALSAAASIVIIGGISVAQDHAAMGPGHMPPMQQMQERHEHMLADLRTVLRIRPDQETAFKAVLDSMPHASAAEPPAPPAANLTTPQMFALHDQMEATMKAKADKHRTAILALYNVLSPDQQQTFDALMRMHHGMGAMHGGMMMMGHGMGGGHMGGPHMDGPMGGPPH